MAAADTRRIYGFRDLTFQYGLADVAAIGVYAHATNRANSYNHVMLAQRHV